MMLIIYLSIYLLTYSSAQDMLRERGREGERGRERNIDVREEHPLVVSRMYTPRSGLNPQPKNTP